MGSKATTTGAEPIALALPRRWLSIIVAIVLVFVHTACSVTPPPSTTTGTPQQPSLDTSPSPSLSPTARVGDHLPVSTVALGVPWKPSRLATDGLSLWVVSRVGHGVAKLSISDSPSLERTASVPGEAFWPVCDGVHLFVSIETDGREAVVALEPTSLAVLASKSMPAYALAITAGRVWVANIDQGPSWVAAYDASLRPQLNPVPVPIETVALASGNGRVWVLSHDEASIVGIDPASGQSVSKYQLDSDPHMLAVGLDSLWVASYHTNEVIRLDSATGRQLARISLPFSPEWMATDARDLWVLPATGGFASDPTDFRLVRINGKTNVVDRIFDLGGKGTDVAWTGGRVWVSIADPSSVLGFVPPL